MKKLPIDPADDDFGVILNCAVRYALGRQSYMPKLVVDFITPLLPKLTERTRACFIRDIDSAERGRMLGDPDIDAPMWLAFREKVKERNVEK